MPMTNVHTIEQLPDGWFRCKESNPPAVGPTFEECKDRAIDIIYRGRYRNG